MAVVLFIFLVLTAAVVFVVINGKAQVAEQKTRDDARRASNAAAESLRLANRQLVDSAFSDWQSITPAREGNRDGFIAINADGSELGVYHCSSSRAHEPSDFLRVPIANIRSIAMEDTTKTVTETHVNRVPVVTQQKKSAGGRALLGAAALGPLGAIAGAASGLNKKTTTTFKEVSRAEQVEKKGPRVLVLGTRDVVKPVLKLRCRTDELTEEWAHRLAALRALAA